MRLPRVLNVTLFIILFSSCTHSQNPTAQLPLATPNPSDRPSETTPPGGLQFDYLSTTELLISKNSPDSGDRWTARIVRDGAPGPENENRWTIELGPDETRSGDNKAHGTFILHMLDTVRTLTLKEPGVSGYLESFGLATPLFSLQWKAQDSPQYELKVGAPVKSPDGQFAGLYAVLGPAGQAQPKVRVATGALLEMLNMIKSFQVLRLPTLATFTSDDVDEIQITSPNGSKFYAQRDGSDWTNARHKTLKKDIDTFLEQTTHLRILKFIDDTKEQAPIRKRLEQSSAVSLTFKNRKSEAVTVRISPMGDHTYATISSRWRADEKGKPLLSVFEIYPEFRDKITKLLK